MSLEEATNDAAAALAAGDLEGLRRALEARRKALDAGEQPTPQIFEAGQRLLGALLAWQQRTAFDSARLGQIRGYVASRAARD